MTSKSPRKSPRKSLRKNLRKNLRRLDGGVDEEVEEVDDSTGRTCPHAAIGTMLLFSSCSANCLQLTCEHESGRFVTRCKSSGFAVSSFAYFFGVILFLEISDSVLFDTTAFGAPVKTVVLLRRRRQALWISQKVSTVNF